MGIGVLDDRFLGKTLGAATRKKKELLAELLEAATIANGGSPPTAKTWRSAKDHACTVVDIDLGWSRHLVFTVEHGHFAPHTVMT